MSFWMLHSYQYLFILFAFYSGHSWVLSWLVYFSKTRTYWLTSNLAIFTTLRYFAQRQVWSHKGLPICNSRGYMVWGDIFFLSPQTKTFFYFPSGLEKQGLRYFYQQVWARIIYYLKKKHIPPMNCKWLAPKVFVLVDWYTTKMMDLTLKTIMKPGWGLCVPYSLFDDVQINSMLNKQRKS